MGQDETGRWRGLAAWVLVAGALGVWLLWPRQRAAVVVAVEDEVAWG